MKRIDDLLAKILAVSVKDVAYLSEEDYAMSRRYSFGASDSATLLGVSPFQDIDSLLTQKNQARVTDEERAIGRKESVRKGKDLEDLILQKFIRCALVDKHPEYFEDIENAYPVSKPENSYVLPDLPQLSVNFDGILIPPDGDIIIPVECKYVTRYGEPYYTREQAWYRDYPEYVPPKPKTAPKRAELRDPGAKNIVDRAAMYGIPVYYYTQIQHQMLALGAPYGYLAVLHDVNWELCVYKILADESLHIRLRFAVERYKHRLPDRPQ